MKGKTGGALRGIASIRGEPKKSIVRDLVLNTSHDRYEQAQIRRSIALESNMS